MKVKLFQKRRPLHEDVASASTLSCIVISASILSIGREYLPNQWRAAPITAIIAFAFTLLIVPFFSAVAEIVYEKSDNEGFLKKSARAAVSLIAVAVALAFMLTALREGCEFVAEAMNISRDRRLIALIFLSTASFIASSGCETVKKFSLVALALTVTVSLFLLILSLTHSGNAEMNLTQLDFPSAVSGEAVKLALRRILLPSTVGAISIGTMRSRVSGDAPMRSVIGLLIGGATVFICLLTAAIVGGLAYPSEVKYPYLSAVGSMSVGRLFLRADGADINPFVKDMNAALHGRGGGRNGFAQGSVEASQQQIQDYFKEFT